MPRAKFCAVCGLNKSMHKGKTCPPKHLWPSSEDDWRVNLANPEKVRYLGISVTPMATPDGANARQVGGDHYKIGGEEHWDRVARLELDYYQGNITKYVERWKKKNGIEDLKKARHYLDKYMELIEAGLIKP